MSSRNRSGRCRSTLLLVVIAAILALASSVPAASQAPGGVPEATVPPIDDVTSDRLKDIFGSDRVDADTGTPEAVSGSLTDDDFGFSVSYTSPWSYDGWWTTDGTTTHFLAVEGTQAGMYITGWERPEDLTVLDYVTWWADPVYVQEWVPGAEALRFTATDTVGAVVHITAPTEDYPEPWVYVTELHFHDTYAVELLFFAPLSEVKDAYSQTVDRLELDDVPFFTVFGPEALDEMLAESSLVTRRTGDAEVGM